MFLSALLLGIVAGLRSMVAPAVVSWAAYVQLLPLKGTWLEFLGAVWTPWIFTLFAIGELIVDKRSDTPPRTMVVSVLVRVSTGALAGAAVGVARGYAVLPVFIAVLGALLGTFAGLALRTYLARLFRRDLPGALIEDLIAIGSAVLAIALMT